MVKGMTELHVSARYMVCRFPGCNENVPSFNSRFWACFYARWHALVGPICEIRVIDQVTGDHILVI